MIKIYFWKQFKIIINYFIYIMNLINFNLVPSDIDKIKKFKTLFRVILRTFYDQID